MATLRFAFVVVLTCITAARASDCPRKGTLGTSRILEVDAATYPRVGLKSFPQMLPLDEKEVVLTFDDGPAATTPRILNALARESSLRPFFRSARAHRCCPAWSRKSRQAAIRWDITHGRTSTLTQ